MQLKALRRKKLFAIGFALLFALSLMGGSSGNASMNAIKLELSSSTATVGFAVSIHATGLADGTVYLVVAVHSGGNITAVTTGNGAEDYVQLLFTSEDSDGVVPIHIGTTTDYAETASYDATTILSLKGPSIPGSQFFTGIIGPLVVISVVVGLASIFAYRKFRS